MGLVQLPNHTCLERIICSIDYHYPHLLKQIRPAGLHAALVILSYLSRIINFAMSVFDRLSSNWEVGGGGVVEYSVFRFQIVVKMLMSLVGRQTDLLGL